jgi:hypothetical protein
MFIILSKLNRNRKMGKSILDRLRAFALIPSGKSRILARYGREVIHESDAIDRLSESRPRDQLLHFRLRFGEVDTSQPLRIFLHPSVVYAKNADDKSL